MNCDWIGQLQVILLSAERNCTHTLFGGSILDVFWENECKIHKSECVKKFQFSS